MDQYLNTAREAAQKSGEILKKHWGTLSTYREKSFEGDLVTIADEESEQEIIRIIQHYHPEHQILSEESGIHEAPNHDYLWVIDPVDGTTNYAHCFPVCAISIALFVKGEPVLGIVSNPIQNEHFEAVKAQGATLNSNSIHVSAVPELRQSLLATGFAYNRRETDENNFKEFCHLTNSCQGVRRLGSAALDLCYVAMGRLDGYWELGLKPWDVAAGALIVQEAGGVVTSYDNTPLDIYSGYILASNGNIHQEIIQELKNA